MVLARELLDAGYQLRDIGRREQTMHRRMDRRCDIRMRRRVLDKSLQRRCCDFRMLSFLGEIIWMDRLDGLGDRSRVEGGHLAREFRRWKVKVVVVGGQVMLGIF